MEALKKFGDMFDQKLAVNNGGNVSILEKKIAVLENQNADLTTKNTKLEIQNKLEKQAKAVAEKQATEAMTAKEKAETQSAADKAAKEAAETQAEEAKVAKKKAEDQSAIDKAAKEVAETKMTEATAAKEVAETQVKELNRKLLTETKRKDNLVELIKKRVDPAADKARSKIIEDYSLSKDSLREFATTVENEKECITIMSYKIICAGSIKPKWAQHVLGAFEEVSNKLLNILQSDKTSDQEVREELEKLLKGGLAVASPKAMISMR